MALNLIITMFLQENRETSEIKRWRESYTQIIQPQAQKTLELPDTEKKKRFVSQDWGENCPGDDVDFRLRASRTAAKQISTAFSYLSFANLL